MVLIFFFYKNIFYSEYSFRSFILLLSVIILVITNSLYHTLIVHGVICINDAKTADRSTIESAKHRDDIADLDKPVGVLFSENKGPIHSKQSNN